MLICSFKTEHNYFYLMNTICTRLRQEIDTTRTDLNSWLTRSVLATRSALSPVRSRRQHTGLWYKFCINSTLFSVRKFVPKTLNAQWIWYLLPINKQKNFLHYLILVDNGSYFALNVVKSCLLNRDVRHRKHCIKSNTGSNKTWLNIKSSYSSTLYLYILTLCVNYILHSWCQKWVLLEAYILYAFA